MESKLKQSLNSWLEWLDFEKRLSSNTVLAYKNDLESFLLFLEDYNSCKVDMKILKDSDKTSIRGWFYQRIQKGITPRSNARALSSIKNFFLFLIKKKIISSSKVLQVKSPKFKDSLPRPLSLKQMIDIIKSLKANKKEWVARRNISILLLLWGVGLRISEALNLKYTNINSGEQIIIKGKGNKERIIPLTKEIKKYLDEMISITPISISHQDFIFLGEKGKKLNPSIFQKEIRNLRIKQLLPDSTTPHSFRHTFASQLLENRVDLRTIQELLGHESLSSTQKYTQIDLTKIRKAIHTFHPRSLNNK